MRFGKTKRNKVIMLIDLENLLINLPTTSPERFSMTVGFDRVIRQISQEAGEIVNVFVFTPPHLALLWSNTFYDQGFFTILCPKVKSKKIKEEDTTDQTIIDFGKGIIDQIPDLTHLCMASGDKDFNPLIRKAIHKGLKIIVVAGNLRSLSSKLISLADKRADGTKMVYLLSPTEE